jgi:sporulation protein YlmC with PRC-barrel domain
MALVKLSEYYPEYTTDVFGGNDLKNYTVYAADDDKVGSVENILIDENSGEFRYLVVDTGFWIFGKKILLPVGLARLDDINQRVYVKGLTKQQVEDLPEFTESLAINDDYEERVRSVYRPFFGAPSTFLYEPATYNYMQEPYFYDMRQQTYPTFRDYEERVRARRRL